MKYLQSFICIICLLMGCTNRVLELKGKVLDENTGAPVPHRKILLEELVPNKMIPVQTNQIITDSSGSFTCTLKRSRSIYLYNFNVVGDSDYAYSENRLGLTELLKYGKFLTFYVRKLADFTIAIEKTTNAAVSDTLYVAWESDGEDGKLLFPYKINNYGQYGNSSGVEFRWIGGDIKSAIKTKVFAEKETIIHWELFRNGENRRITDTIVCRRNMNNYTLFKY